MSENSTLNKNTKIEFSIAYFFSTIGSILVIFFLFYTYVVKPAIDDNKDDITKLETEFKVLTKEQTKNMIEFNTAVTKLNSNLEIINNRFNDLNKIRNDQDNSNGGFSMNNINNSTYNILDTLLIVDN